MTQTPPPDTDFSPRHIESPAAKKKLFGRLSRRLWAAIAVAVLAIVVAGSFHVFGGHSPQYKAGYSAGKIDVWAAHYSGASLAHMTPENLCLFQMATDLNGGQVIAGLGAHATKAQVQQYLDGCAAGVTDAMNH